MTRKEALTALLEKVEAGISGRWGFEALGDDAEGFALGAFHGSLDDALALHEAVLPEFTWQVQNFGKPYAIVDLVNGGCARGGTDNIPARAWLQAILQALIEQETSASQ